MVGKGVQGPGKPDLLLLLNEIVRVRRKLADFTLSDQISPTNLQTARQCYETVRGTELQRTRHPHCALWNLIFLHCFSLIQHPLSLLKKYMWAFMYGNCTGGGLWIRRHLLAEPAASHAGCRLHSYTGKKEANGRQKAFSRMVKEDRSMKTRRSEERGF